MVLLDELKIGDVDSGLGRNLLKGDALPLSQLF